MDVKLIIERGFFLSFLSYSLFFLIRFYQY